MPNGCTIWLNGAFGMGKTTDNGEAPGYSSTDGGPTERRTTHLGAETGGGGDHSIGEARA